MGQVIGFLDYGDFIDEVEQCRGSEIWRDWFPPIRVQDYIKRSSPAQIGLTRIDFVVDVVVVIGDDVLVCRFKMGGGIKDIDERQIEQRREYALRAVALVTADLEGRSLTVRRGIVTDARSADVDTSPGWLWHYKEVDGGWRLFDGPFPGVIM